MVPIKMSTFSIITNSFALLRAEIDLKLVISCRKFYLSFQDTPFRINFIGGQFKSISNIIGKGGGGPGIGINNPYFNGALGFDTGRMENKQYRPKWTAIMQKFSC